MAALSKSMVSAADGEGDAAFLAGGVGMGKTAVLEQAASYAAGLGMQVLFGASHELDRLCPFAAVSACLGAHVAATDVWRASVAEISLGDARHGSPGAMGRAEVADPATVEAMEGLVGELCARGPVALFLDDLQWADPASVLVLRRLMASIHQLPLVVVGAYRPSPRGGGVDRLLQSVGLGNQTVLELGPLHGSAVSALLTDLCDGEPGPRLRRMAERAAGSPLYLVELVEALRRESLIEVDDGIAEVNTDHLPPSLATLVTHRLSFLCDDTLHALRVAAVLGASCTVAEFAAVLEKPTHDVVRIVTEAEAAGVLRAAGDRLVFRHDLVRQALSDAVSSPVRAMLHMKAAQVLAGAGVAPERVAEYLLDAAPAGEFLLEWLAEFAPRLTTRAPGLALRLLDEAVELADPMDPRQDQLQLHRVVAQLSCGQLIEAEEGARRSLARSRDPGMEGAMRWILVHAAFGRGRPGLALSEARTAYLSEGLTALEGNRFRAFSSVCLFMLGKVHQAGEEAHAAQRAAEASGDAEALAYALQTLAAKRFLEAPDTEALELARQAVVLAPQTIHPAPRIGLQLALANFYIELDRGLDAERTLVAAYKATEHFGGVFLPWYHFSCALLAFNTGRWDAALAEVEEGLGPGASFGMSRALWAIAALIAVHRDQLELAEAHLAAAAAAREGAWAGRFHECLPLLASVLLDEANGNVGRAYTRLIGAFDEGNGRLTSQLIPGVLAPDIVRLALTHGDLPSARRVASAARQRADYSSGPHHLGDTYRSQGLLNRDSHLLLQAARCYHDAPRPLDEAHCYTDAAELLAQERRQDESCALLDQAIDIYTHLDAQWDIARALSRLRSVHPARRRSRAHHGWLALTRTERIVADHVAQGLSNPVIAARMSISRRTVSTHVSNILKKLHMTSRVELATEVIRQENGVGERPVE